MSSTLLAGRGAGRGGSSSARRDRPDHRRVVAAGARGSRRRTRTSVTATLVGDVVHAAAPVDRQPPQHRRQVGGERRAPTLVVDEGQAARLPGPLGGQAPHESLTMFAPVLRRTPTTCARRRPTLRAPRLPLAGQLGRAVHRLRPRLVPLAVRTVERAVEDVVRRHVHEVGADAGAPLGDPAHGEGVGRERPLGIGLAGVDRRPRRGVDDGVRAERWSATPSTASRSVTSSCAVVRGPATSSPAALARADDVVAELPAGPGDEQPHVRTSARAFSGSHHSRLSRYQSTVLRPARRRGRAPFASRAPRSCRS